MKFLATLVLAVALSAGHCVPVHRALPTQDQIMKLTDAALIYLHSVLPKVDSEPLSSFVNQRFSLPEISTDLTASGKNGVEYGVNEVVFDEYGFDSSTLSTRFCLTAPNLTLVYDTEIEGKIFGEKVSGKGTTKCIVAGSRYIVDDLRFEEINHSLQIASLDMRIFREVERFEFEGLNVETKTLEQLEYRLEMYLREKFEESIEEQSKLLSAFAKTNFNEAMSGLSTDEVIQWLKEHANGEVPTDLFQNFVTGFSMVQ